MFDNIGKKIKGLAKFITWIGIIISVIVGFVFILVGLGFDSDFGSNSGAGLIVTGLVIAIVGSLFSWFGSFLLYGYGQLISSTETATYYTKQTHDKVCNIDASVCQLIEALSSEENEN